MEDRPIRPCELSGDWGANVPYSSLGLGSVISTQPGLNLTGKSAANLMPTLPSRSSGPLYDSFTNHFCLDCRFGDTFFTIAMGHPIIWNYLPVGLLRFLRDVIVWLLGGLGGIPLLLVESKEGVVVLGAFPGSKILTGHPDGSLTWTDSSIRKRSNLVATIMACLVCYRRRRETGLDGWEMAAKASGFCGTNDDETSG